MTTLVFPVTCPRRCRLVDCSESLYTGVFPLTVCWVEGSDPVRAYTRLKVNHSVPLCGISVETVLVLTRIGRRQLCICFFFCVLNLGNSGYAFQREPKVAFGDCERATPAWRKCWNRGSFKRRFRHCCNKGAMSGLVWFSLIFQFPTTTDGLAVCLCLVRGTQVLFGSNVLSTPKVGPSTGLLVRYIYRMCK